MPSVEELEKEIEELHTLAESKGLNSRKTKDIFGRTFPYPVNAEHKATTFFPILMTNKQPHMRTFWAATLGFFCTFFSTFAPSALGSYIKRAPPDGIGLVRTQIGLAGNLAVTGTILMRVASGSLCDILGVRKTFLFLLGIGIPGMVIVATTENYELFVIGRVLIGLSLATFVTCQVWCSQFFDRKIVGQVNATAGGWGNVGGGVTLLVMPQIVKALIKATDDIGTSWRVAFILPIVMHLVAMAFIFTGRDLPDGSYKQLEMSGAKQKSKGAANVMVLGFTNTNALIMLVTYGLCFGVELCMNNKLVPYFERYYAFPNEIAGPLGATFSLMNLFARSWGGILSDYLGARYGLRGRITGMWVIQTCEAFMCIVLGLITQPYMSPDDASFVGAPKVNSTFLSAYGEAYVITDPLLAVKPCASSLIRSPATALKNGLLVDMPMAANTYITVRDNTTPNCVHTEAPLAGTLTAIVFFSIFVQMAEGLHFGIVPYISRPALGVVSGMVGAGGNAGALITGQFVVGNKGNLDDGFVRLGFVILIGSMLMHFIYFPDAGGILWKKGGWYDPQLVKQGVDQKGADELNFDKAKTTTASV